MGIFDWFKKKEKTSQSGDFDDKIETTYDLLMTFFQVQSVMTEGSLVPKDSLPKDEWVYGYMYGFIDCWFQASALKDSENAWMIVTIRIFKAYFGDKLGNDICHKFPDLQKKDKFSTGVKTGGQDLFDFMKDEKMSPMGLQFYLFKFMKTSKGKE